MFHVHINPIQFVFLGIKCSVRMIIAIRTFDMKHFPNTFTTVAEHFNSNSVINLTLITFTDLCIQIYRLDLLVIIPFYYTWFTCSFSINAPFCKISRFANAVDFLWSCEGIFLLCFLGQWQSPGIGPRGTILFKH